MADDESWQPDGDRSPDVNPDGSMRTDDDSDDDGQWGAGSDDDELWGEDSEGETEDADGSESGVTVVDGERVRVEVDGAERAAVELDDAIDDDGNVAGELIPETSVEPETVDAENTLFVVAGVFLAVVIFAALLTPSGWFTLTRLAGLVGVTAVLGGLGYVLFNRL